VVVIAPIVTDVKASVGIPVLATDVLLAGGAGRRRDKSDRAPGLSFTPVVVASWRLTMRSLTPQRARPSEHAVEQTFGADPCAALGREIPAQVDVAQLEPGPSLTQVISSDVSDASAIPHKTGDLDAGGRIWHGRMRLRALWASRPVVVRVHSSAWKEPGNQRLTVACDAFVIAYKPFRDKV
jgi:hypothetical protein